MNINKTILALAIALITQSMFAICIDVGPMTKAGFPTEQEAANNQAKFAEFYEKLACKELCAECKAILLAREVVSAQKKVEWAKIRAEAKANKDQQEYVIIEPNKPNGRRYIIRGKKAKEFFEANRRWLEN